MTSHACVTCGVPQARWRDRSGVEHTNINPLTGECLDCLVTSVRGSQPPPLEDAEFDAKQAQAGRDE